MGDSESPLNASIDAAVGISIRRAVEKVFEFVNRNDGRIIRRRTLGPRTMLFMALFKQLLQLLLLVNPALLLDDGDDDKTNLKKAIVNRRLSVE